MPAVVNGIQAAGGKEWVPVEGWTGAFFIGLSRVPPLTADSRLPVLSESGQHGSRLAAASARVLIEVQH
jgi:hypothetical protein